MNAKKVIPAASPTSPVKSKRTSRSRGERGEWSSHESGAESIGGSGHAKRRCFRALGLKKLKPRTALYMMFTFVELVSLGIFLLTLAASTKAVFKNYEGAAEDSISAMHAAVAKKTDQLFRTVTNSGLAAGTQRFIDQGTAATAADKTTISTLYTHLQQQFEVEFVTLVDDTYNILYTANAGLQNGTEYFNPAGILDKAKAADQTVFTFATVSYEDLKAQGAPLFRDRANALDMAFAGGSAMDTKTSSLVRWIAGPVYLREGGYVKTPGSFPVGYIIIGDVMNGKSALTSAVVEELGGYAGVYGRAETSAQGVSPPWSTISSSVLSKVTGVSEATGKKTFMEFLVQGWSPYSALSTNERFNEVIAFKEELATTTTALFDVVRPYSLAARSWIVGDPSEVSNNAPPEMVLSRGVPIDPAALSDLRARMWIGLSVTFLLDCLTLMLATALFLAPLEKMGKKVKAGQKIDMAYLHSLTKRRHWSVVPAAVALASLGVSVWLGLQGGFAMEQAVNARSAQQPGALKLAWQTYIHAAESLMRSVQTNNGLRKVLVEPENPAHTASAVQRLAILEEVLEMEFALMFDQQGKLLLAPQNMGAINVTDFDPATLVHSTLNTSVGYTRTALVDYDTMRRFNCTQYSRKYKPTTPTSKLHPYDTKAETLIRWVSIPVWKTNNQKVPAQGVLLIGDIVNGKTRMAENAIVGKGYSGVYYLNSTGHYVMAAGVRRADGVTYTVDEEMPETAWLEALRYDPTWTQDSQTYTQWHGSYKGKPHIMSAQCMSVDTMVNDDGFNPFFKTYNGTDTSQCTVFLVQGMPTAAVKSLLSPGYAWQYVFIAVCVLKLIGLGYLCYRAYLPFHKIVVTNKLVQTNRGLNGTITPTSGSPTPSGMSPTAAKYNATGGRAPSRKSENNFSVSEASDMPYKSAKDSVHEAGSTNVPPPL